MRRISMLGILLFGLMAMGCSFDVAVPELEQFDAGVVNPDAAESPYDATDANWYYDAPDATWYYDAADAYVPWPDAHIPDAAT